MNSLDKYSDFFSAYALKFLNKNGITNLEGLFNWTNNLSLLSFFPNNCSSSIKMYKEIYGTSKLLKCYYFNENPMLDIYKPLTMKEQIDFLYEMGLSVKSANCLARANFTRDKILLFFKNNTIEEELVKVESLGRRSINEIILKFKILIDYYDKNPKIDDEINDLVFELNILYQQRNTIDQKIYTLEDKIENMKRLRIKKK